MSADILLPKQVAMNKWSVVACDQFTSQPAYWERVRTLVGNAPSTIHLVFPEAELEMEKQSKIKSIHENMRRYVSEELFEEYKDSYIYVERVMQNGTVRKGIVGVIDLEEYDYKDGSKAKIRATEETVVERIPPRMDIRRDAELELPHVLLFCDDKEDALIGPLENRKNCLKKLYDFELMEDGGHIAGWLMDGAEAEAFSQRFSDYEGKMQRENSMVLAVGDGNHSLATAKACYDECKAAHPELDWEKHPARYALVELENIHDEAQKFEPIHRVVTQTNVDKILVELKQKIGAEHGMKIKCCRGVQEETICLRSDLGQLAIGVLQKFLDDYLARNKGVIDYIHGDFVVRELAREDSVIGFLVPTIEKDHLFAGIAHDGVLPRKTFSMGHAQEKRYYLESRKIK